MIVNGVETKYTYYVLDGAEKDIWIIVNDGVETTVTDNTVAISVDNVSYKKLKSYTVTFVNGQSREETVVNGGYYKVEEPEKPTKLGYTFERAYYLCKETHAFEGVSNAPLFRARNRLRQIRRTRIFRLGNRVLRLGRGTADYDF